MNQLQITEIIKTKRLILKRWEQFIFYLLAFLSFFIFVLILSQDIWNNDNFQLFEFKFGYLFLMFAIIILISKKKSLKFKKFKNSFTIQQLFDKTKNALQNRNWILIDKSENYLVWESDESIILKNNERITIIWTEKALLINSICNPLNARAIFSFGRNKNNIYLIERLVKFQPNVSKNKSTNQL